MGWTRQVTGLLVSIIALLILYWSSAHDLVGLWSASEAYHFLYLVLPVSAYIIWSRRERLVRIAPKLRLWAFIPLVAFAGLWLVSRAAFLAIGEHVALIGMLQSLLMLFLGGRVFWALLFPFLLMWMMVPVGDSFMPALVSLTVTLSQSALTLVGNSTSVDGTILITEAGRYGVVEECSSLPFIVGNLLVTLVFANLNYRRFHKQALLVLLSVPVALLANTLRILGVVLITEWSEGSIDLVADHATFGWIIFAVTVAVELLIAARFAEAQTSLAVLAKQEPRFAKRLSARPLVAATTVVVVGLLAVPHVWLAYVSPAAAETPKACVPGSLFEDDGASSDWRPRYADTPDYAEQGQIMTDAGPVDIYVAYYQRQTEARELVGWRNRPYDEETWWLHNTLPGPEYVSRDMPTPDTVRLRNIEKDRRLVWTWYWVDGRFTGDPLTAKLRQATTILKGGQGAGGALILSVAENYEPESAEPKLRAALAAMDAPERIMVRAARFACRGADQ